MEQLNEIFLENNEDNSSEKIIEKIQKGELNDILTKLCFINKNAIIINYIYFLSNSIVIKTVPCNGTTRNRQKLKPLYKFI